LRKLIADAGDRLDDPGAEIHLSHVLEIGNVEVGRPIERQPSGVLQQRGSCEPAVATVPKLAGIARDGLDDAGCSSDFADCPGNNVGDV
jgi:hypothetical protein